MHSWFEETSKVRPAFWVGLLVVSMALLGFGTPALAQETQAEPEEEELIAEAMERSFEEEITVTGTLIPRGDLTALSPVTVMEVADELRFSGINRMEDLIVQLPQAFAGQNSTIANAASGTATIDLRFLGTYRTLVLINGRRLAPGDSSGSYAPDINVIPASIVKRVDVLTGGASTVYGSDAVAGVVNFVMDTDFEGVRGGVQYSGYYHDNSNTLAQEANDVLGFEYPTGYDWDGEAINANIAIGGKFADGKGHAVAYIDYRNIESVVKAQRDYLTCTMVARGEDGPACSGSVYNQYGVFETYDANDNYTGFWILNHSDFGGDGHSFIPFNGTRFNYNAYNHVQRPDEKLNAGVFAHYTINDHFEPYLEVMMMDDFTDAQIAPSANFGVYNYINCDNPMLSEQQWNIVCGPDTGFGPNDIAYVWQGRRNVESIAGRNNALGHTNWRILAGMRGDINDAWSYDFYYMRTENNSQDAYENDLSITRIGNALDIIEDPETGEWVCRSGDAGCVPWNVFQEGQITQEALDYISMVAVMWGVTRTEVANLTFTSDWENYGVTIPGASEGVQVAIGGEWRKEFLENMPDEAYRQGTPAGFGGATEKLIGEFTVEELFVEALVPIVQDTTGFRDLSLELGYRYSDWSTSGGFSTYKGMLSWAINDSWRLRGGYNRAVRGANIFELFRPRGYNLSGSIDPCANQPATGVPQATLEQCLNTGMTAAQYGTVRANPSNQYNTLEGGNPDLIPETADTITAGVVWTPQSIAGLSLTLDYYLIDITDTIGTLGADSIITTCINTGDPALCSLINRNSRGSLWQSQDGYTLDTFANIGDLTAEGVDLNFNYLLGLGGSGYMNMDLMGSYLLQSRSANPLYDYDCVGYFGFQCSQPQAVWRHRFRATWETNFNFNFSLAWRYLHGSENDDGSPDEDLANPAQMELWTGSYMDKFPAYNWFDIAASYTFANAVTLTLGVNNVFDKEPPLAPELSDDPNHTLHGSYEPLGRYIFTSLQFNF